MSDEASVLWDLRTLVNDDVALAYAIREIVGDELELRYAIRELVGKQLFLIYNAESAVIIEDYVVTAVMLDRAWRAGFGKRPVTAKVLTRPTRTLMEDDTTEVEVLTPWRASL